MSCFADPTFKVILSWLSAGGLIGFLAMGIDKSRASSFESRIPELAFFAESVIGGFWGVLLGALVFHHKTSKPSFLLVVLGSSVLWFLILSRTGFLGCLQSIIATALGL